MDSQELRDKFIKFFESKGHKLVASASLISENDPSVLFTTAGMQQFKRFYSNPEEALEKFGTKNVVTCQPCLRTSDIEEVGDETHLTFFEMLGNFSFGGYFKKDAIKWGYEFLIQELGIESKRIKCSIFKGDEKNPRDKESSDILQNIGISFEEHGRDDNFWGPTGSEGPCGPTVEFYVDGVEVWNLVFNEYYFKRSEKQGSATVGSYFRDDKYEPLKTKGVDTGMGLERMLVVINKAENIYHTDLFNLPHKKLHELLQKEEPIVERIILDHIKAATFAINDGILPSNKDAGYIVRRLIRRAVVKASQIGINENFTSKLASEVIKTYENVYSFDQEKIEKELKNEESKFRQTLKFGLKKFEKTFLATENGDNLLTEDGNKIETEQIISGKKAFDIYQTYGFPKEMIIELARENGLELDEKGFREELKKHQDTSRAGVIGFKSGLVGESEITTRMHTATHLLLKALQEVLGKDIHQRGSNINEERIRFDFSYPKPMTEEGIEEVESIVNEKIRENIPVEKKETTVEEAKKFGAEAQFLSKYNQYDKLTIYSIGDYSRELCGGPHVKSTGEIGKFKIIKEESSSSGVRRIRAVLE